MNRRTVQLGLFALLLAVALPAKADRQTGTNERFVSPLPQLVTTLPGAPLSDRTPVLVPGKDPVVVNRTDSPSPAILELGSLPALLCIARTQHSASVNQFEQGIYLRYRPRDPPTA